MTDLKARIKAAKDAGYSDEDIRARLSEFPEIKRARDAGYSDATIFGRLGLEVETPEVRGEVGFFEDLPRRAGRKIVHAAERLGASPEEIVSGGIEAIGNIPESAIGAGGQAYDLANLAMTPSMWPAAGAAVAESVKRLPARALEIVQSPEDALADFASYAVKDPVNAMASVSAATGGVGALMRPGNVMSEISRLSSPLGLAQVAASAAPASVAAVTGGIGAFMQPGNIMSRTANALAPMAVPGRAAQGAYEFGQNFISPVFTQAGAERAAGDQILAAKMGALPNFLAALRAKPESIIGQVPASQRLAAAGEFEPVLTTLEGDLRTGLTPQGRRGLQVEQERLVAIQQQLKAVDDQIMQQGAALTPEASANLNRVRSDLLQAYDRELQAQQARIGAVGARLPATGQLGPGAAIAGRAAELRREFRDRYVRPLYDRAFRAAGSAEAIDLSGVLGEARRILGRPLSFYDPRTAPRVARRLALAEPAAEELPLRVDLREADAIRKAINSEIGAARAAAPESPLLRQLNNLHHRLDTAVMGSEIPDAAKTAYRDALDFYRESYVPRFRTGIAYDLLRTTKKNQTGLLTGDTVARILSKEENAAQFAATFGNDPVARDAMQTGLLDLARREVIDPTTGAVDPRAIDKFIFDHQRQMELMGIDGASLLAPVRREAQALHNGFTELDREAAFTRGVGGRAATTAKELVDRLVKDPAAMDAARRRLSEDGRMALTRELTDRAVKFINSRDPQKAIDFLTKDATAVNMVLNKQAISQLVDLAEKQKTLLQVKSEAIEPALENMVVDLSNVSPDKLTDLGLVAQELKRIKAAENLMEQRPSPEVRKIGQEGIEAARKKKPEYISSALTTFDKLLKTLGEFANRKTIAVLSDVLISNPEKAADLVEQAAARQVKAPPLPESRGKTLRRAVVSGAISSQNDRSSK